MDLSTSRPTARLHAGAILLAAGLAGAIPGHAQTLPRYDHIVVVIDENKNDTEIRGSALAPYINNVLIPNSADFTKFVAETHPSQPNYLHFFSGSNQGVLQDGLPGSAAEPGTLLAPPPFHTPNLGRELLNAGRTFATFSESLPTTGFTGEQFSATPGLNEYVRKHNPSVNWQDDTATVASNPWALPSSTNRAFSAFGTTAADFARLPAVSIVVPNEQNDMHDGTIQQGDDWLKNNIEPYRQWALANNSLLIFTFDESDLGEFAADPTNQIITLASGAFVKNGSYDEMAIAQFRLSNAAAPATAINHYNLLNTIETLMGTSQDATAVAEAGNPGVNVQPITDIFTTTVPEPGTNALLAAAGVTALVGGVLRRQRRTRATKA